MSYLNHIKRIKQVMRGVFNMDYFIVSMERQIEDFTINDDDYKIDNKESEV